MDVDLEWDAMPDGQVWSHVRAYAGETLVGEVVMPATTMTAAVIRVIDSYTVKSYTAADGESEASNAITYRSPVHSITYRVA